MLVRILIMTIGCWSSAISAAGCPTNTRSLTFTEDEGTWCYTVNNNKTCIEELKGFQLVELPDYSAPDQYLVYCNDSWQTQGTMQHGQHDPTQGTEQNPGQQGVVLKESSTTQQGTLSTGGAVGGKPGGTEGSIQLP